MKTVKNLNFLMILFAFLYFDTFSQNISPIETVVETKVEPFSQVCYIQTKRTRRVWFNKTPGSTGFFIAPNVILTAGHNLHSTKLTRVDKIRIVPGRYKDSHSYDPIEIEGRLVVQSSIFVHPGFGWRKINYDFGIIIIPDSIINSTQNWPRSTVFSLNPDYSLTKGDTISIAGFPAEGNYDGSLMTHEIQLCGDIVGKKIYHSFTTTGGNSGSPIWVEKNGQRIIVGVHTYPNKGTKIDKEYIQLIEKWIKEKTLSN